MERLRSTVDRPCRGVCAAWSAAHGVERRERSWRVPRAHRGQNLGRRAMLFIGGSSVCVGACGRPCTGGALAGPSQRGICRVGRDSPECGTVRGGGRVTSRSPVPAATPPTAVACRLLPSQILPPLNAHCLCPHSTSLVRSHPEIPLSRLPVPGPRPPGLALALREGLLCSWESVPGSHSYSSPQGAAFRSWSPEGLRGCCLLPGPGCGTNRDVC